MRIYGAQGWGRRRRSGLPMFVRKKRAAKPRAESRANESQSRGGKVGRTCRRPGAAPSRPDRPLPVAAGVYLVFVLFFGWEGGKVGYGIETGLLPVGRRRRPDLHLLMLVLGVVLVTGTSISILRGFGRGTRRVVVGSRGMAETAIQTAGTAQEKTLRFEPAPAPPT